jgi:hypothetical protein
MWQAPDLMRGLGKLLRAQQDDDTRERLSERWIDLIRYLDAKKRRDAKPRQSKSSTPGP